MLLITCYPQYLTCDSVFRNQAMTVLWIHVVFLVIAGSSLQVLADNDRGTWIVLWERRHSHSHCSFSAALQTLYSPNAPALSVSVMFVMCVCGRGLFRDLQPDRDASGPNQSHLYARRRWTLWDHRIAPLTLWNTVTIQMQNTAEELNVCLC